jgi:hypothetical protein
MLYCAAPEVGVCVVEIASAAVVPGRTSYPGSGCHDAGG